MTSLNFSLLKNAVAAQFDKLVATGSLFRTAADKDGMWITYLDAFPEGTNPIFRERTEHDGSYDKAFIRAVGNVVAIVGNEVVSLWDIEVPGEPAYAVVMEAMAKYVKQFPIANIFVHTEPVAGVDYNYEEINGQPHKWEHFYVRMPRKNSGVGYYVPGVQAGPVLAEARSDYDVLERGLRELTTEALDTTLELIAQNSLYRGQDYQSSLSKFRVIKTMYDATPESKRSAFVWSIIDRLPGPVKRLRSTAIGTLLIDLSEGEELEGAVRKFETSIMAPANYKRPTALVSPKMIEKAKETVEELGLTSALERRYAYLEDISVNDVLFADRSARPAMKGGAFDDLATKASKPKNLDKIESIGIEDFIKNVVPTAQTIEVMVENKHSGNFVSLIAPVDPHAGRLFKWDNNFSWSYHGDVADSIKERVKRAGGRVEGDVLCRLAWFNTDDLDLHMKEPKGGHIYYGNKGSITANGRLDVDMNVGVPVRDAVENIFYADHKKMAPGLYTLYVNNFNKRESVDVGFEVEIEVLGERRLFVYDKPVRSGENVVVAEIEVSHGKVEVIPKLPSTAGAGREIWGVKTQDFHKVNVLTLSPNFWDGHGVGNRHYFFMLEGCKNDGTARGFYNEFLREELTPHRKVIEMVGAKMRTEESDRQLSGLGFSSTQRNEVLVRVTGAFTRTVKVVF